MKDFEIRCDESRLETTNLIYGKFTLGPFLPGQATTFGNALRRSLLAELSGLAITAFEIIGVMQEFSTLPGLRESILDLSLNLKQIILTGVLPHSTPPIGFLNVRGPAIIKAGDLKLPAGVYCASPNQYIATLGSNGMLHFKFVVSVGKGYSIQPYSIYRSLSKIRLQPASNLDNTAVSAKQRKGSKALDYTTPSYASPSATQAPYSEGVKGDGVKGLLGYESDASLPLMKYQEKQFETLQSKETSALPYHTNVGKLSSDASPPRYTEGVTAITKQRACVAEEQALLGSFSTNGEAPHLLSGLRTESSYINIQTQLFQRITPHQVLPIDAVFTPVSQVNFLTEVNDRFETARENIVLEIWTNGSIHPKRALEEATLSLVHNFDTLLKKIQKASSFYKGLRYWTYLQPNPILAQRSETSGGKGVNHPNASLSSLGEKANGNEPLANSFEHKRGFQNGSRLRRLATEGRVEESEEKELLEKLFKNDLPQSIYNLDIGNLNISLQTFIFLKKAKIHTLLQLLTQFSFKQNNTSAAFMGTRLSTEGACVAEGMGIRLSTETPKRGEGDLPRGGMIALGVHFSEVKSDFLNEKIVEELNDLIRQFASKE